MRFSTGEIFADSYKILSLVGAGAWADVYLAEQTALRRQVALKILHEHLLGDPAKLERFRREAQAVSLVKHPNICQVYDYGADADGRPFCAMEFIDGEPLSAILSRRTRLPAGEALTLFAAICEALATAHDSGVLHRDIKPSNIVVARDRRPVLVDFGLAKHFDDSGEESTTHLRLSATGTTLGTAAYMSPEQSQGLPLDRRSDIYSLACVIYETLAGEKPIAAESDLLYLRAHVHDQVKPFARDLNIPSAAKQAVLSALAKNPADRPADARSFARQMAGSEAPPAVQGPARRTRLGATIALAAVAACAVWAGAYWFTHQHGAPAPVTPANTKSVAELYAEAKHAFDSGQIRRGREFLELMVASIEHDPSQVDTGGLDNLIQCIFSAKYERTVDNHGIQILKRLIAMLSRSRRPDDPLLIHLQVALAEMFITQDPNPEAVTPDYLYNPFVYNADRVLTSIIPLLPDRRRDMSNDITLALLQQARICDLTSRWKEVIKLLDRYERMYNQNGLTDTGRLQHAVLMRASAYALDGQLKKSAGEFDRALQITPGVNGIPAADEAAVYHTAAETWIFVGMTDRGRDAMKQCEQRIHLLGDASQQRQMMGNIYPWGLWCGYPNQYIARMRAMMRPQLLSRKITPSTIAVDFGGRDMRDGDVARLKNPEAIRAMSLDATLVTDALAPIISRFRKMEELSLGVTDIGENVVAAAAMLPSLRGIDLTCTFTNDKALLGLTSAKSLTEISLANTVVSNAGMNTMAKLRSLTMLNLRNTMVNDEGVAHLASLSHLKKLVLYQNPLMHGTSFKSLPQLENLCFAGPHTTEVDLSGIRTMRSLKVLELPMTPTTDDMLSFLPELRNLEEVNLGCTACGDQTVAAAAMAEA